MNIPRYLLAGAVLTVTCTCLADVPASLTWFDLVSHPERWPADTRLNVDLQFSKATLKKGTPVQIDSVSAQGAELVAPQGFLFDVGPQECDLLASANAFWSGLTPAQQALTPQAIAHDPSLWPAQVKIKNDSMFGTLQIAAGTVLPVAKVDSDEVGTIDSRMKGLLMFSIPGTDLFSQSRKLAALPLNERPGRMAALFAGMAVDADGKPVNLPPAKFYVLYYAASTCARCEVFTPKLVEHYNATLAGRKDVVFLTWTGEPTTPPMLAYVKKNKIPWPTIPAMARVSDRMYQDYGLINTPSLLVLDRFGTLRLCTSHFPGAPLDAANASLAQLDSVLKPELADSP